MESEPAIDLNGLEKGTELVPLQREIVQENINRYAEASRDFNPIHIDESFAQTTPLGGTIAHGMLILAYVSQMLTANFGKSWIDNGKLNARFKSPARPGDTVTISGAVRKTETLENRSVYCDILCRNQADETVITAEAVVKISDK